MLFSYHWKEQNTVWDYFLKTLNTCVIKLATENKGHRVHYSNVDDLTSLIFFRNQQFLPLDHIHFSLPTDIVSKKLNDFFFSEHIPYDFWDYPSVSASKFHFKSKL